MIPGHPDPTPHIRCQQCVRFIPSTVAVALIINQADATVLCDECHTMQTRNRSKN